MSSKAGSNATASSARPSASEKPFASVKAYGAKGDGRSDDTAQITAAIRATPAGKTLVFPKGIYVISAPLALERRITLRGEGAALKCAARPREDLLRYGLHLRISAARTTIDSLGIAQPLNPAVLPTTDELTCINITDTPDVVITGCHLTGKGLGRILVAGPKSRNVEISHNVLRDGPGIVYSWSGASRTRCLNNTIINSRANAMSGTGNGDTPNKDCVVSGNTITNAGRMGIEDWGLCQGTHIVGNTIRGVGVKDSGAGFGISAVSVRPVVEKNLIEGFRSDAIETTGSGAVIRGNTLRRTTTRIHEGTGVIVNNFVKDTRLGATVSGNRIEKCNKGVVVFAAAGPVTISNNTIVDTNTPISKESSDPTTTIRSAGNIIR